MLLSCWVSLLGFSSRWVFLTTLRADPRLGTTWGAGERGMLRAPAVPPAGRGLLFSKLQVTSLRLA